jgi:superfamily II DNA/RNA helicase
MHSFRNNRGSSHRGSTQSRPTRFGGRPHVRSFSRGGHGSSRGRSGGKSRNFGTYINPEKFINRAIITEETAPFVPEHAFSDFAVVDQLKKAIALKGYVTPTPIQDRAIPHVLQGRDVLGLANTGTGKTAAFLIPLIHKVLTNKETNMLVIVPTRELALQIEDELKSLTRGMGIFSVCCVGGANIVPQIRALRSRNQFVIGTPGRLKDLIERDVLPVHKFNTIVLDEADRMLDMGFIHDMREVMGQMPKPRHTLFFSATLSTEIERLIQEFLIDPVRIKVSTAATAASVDQDVVRVTPGKQKIDLLHDLLIGSEFKKVIVFGTTKHGVEKLANTLRDRGFKVDSIHGNKSHSQRQRALGGFKRGDLHVLVATDVAARGLDVEDISHVINYDIPQTYDDYVHRIGRTGRGAKKGKALTFVEH